MCRDATRIDRGDAHPGVFQFGIQPLGQELDGRLARAVDRLTRDRDEGAHARDIDQGCLGTGEQAWEELLARRHDAPEVDRHHRLDLGTVEVTERHERLDDARHVDEAVDMAVRRDDFCGKDGHGVDRGEVDVVGGEAVPGSCERARLGEPFGAQVGGGDSRSAGQQDKHHLAPDPVPASGDDDDLVGELHGVSFPHL